MISRREYEEARKKTKEFFNKAAIVITPQEFNNIEVADFGLGELASTGLELVVYVNTERVCAKEMVLLPRQTCPEHRHPSIKGEPGKEETFRCRWGRVFLYVPGSPINNPQATPPKGREHTYTVWHEVELNPGEQYTILPDTLHWFQAGDEGAVISEFSTKSRDELDIFTDPEIQRVAKIES